VLCYWSMFLENMRGKKNNIGVGMFVCVWMSFWPMCWVREKQKTNLLEREQQQGNIKKMKMPQDVGRYGQLVCKLEGGE